MLYRNRKKRRSSLSAVSRIRCYFSCCKNSTSWEDREMEIPFLSLSNKEPFLRIPGTKTSTGICLSAIRNSESALGALEGH